MSAWWSWYPLHRLPSTLPERRPGARRMRGQERTKRHRIGMPLLPGLRSAGDQFKFEVQRSSHTRAITPLRTAGIGFEKQETVSGRAEPPTDVSIV